MRNLSRFLILFLIVAMAAAIFSGNHTSYEVFDAENLRADLVVITSIDRVKHEVFAVNCNGKIVCFEEDDDWYVGDYAIVVFESDPNSDSDKVLVTLYERPDLVARWGSEIGFDSEA